MKRFTRGGEQTGVCVWVKECACGESARATMMWRVVEVGNGAVGCRALECCVSVAGVVGTTSESLYRIITFNKLCQMGSECVCVSVSVCV